MIDDGRNYFGFKILTGNHAYYLSFNPMQGDYNFYCYAYERSRLEKCFPAFAPVKPSIVEQARTPPEQEQPGDKPKKSKRMGIE